MHALRDEIGPAAKRYGHPRWTRNAETCRGLAAHAIRCDDAAAVDRLLGVLAAGSLR